MREADALAALRVDEHDVGRVVELAPLRRDPVALPHRLQAPPVAVTFVYSHCEDSCPALVDQVRGALDETGADVPLLAVSVDPAGDTRASARRFLNERRMTGRARFLLGDERALAPVWKGYGVAPQRGELDHSATVVLVDAQGRQRVGFPHDQLTPEALAHDIRRLTGASARA